MFKSFEKLQKNSYAWLIVVRFANIWSGLRVQSAKLWQCLLVTAHGDGHVCCKSICVKKSPAKLNMGGGGGKGSSRVDVGQTSHGDYEGRESVGHDDRVIVCCEEEDRIGGSAEGNDFILIFVEICVVVDEEDRELEGKEVGNRHGAKIGDVDGEEDLEKSHDCKTTAERTLENQMQAST